MRINRCNKASYLYFDINNIYFKEFHLLGYYSAKLLFSNKIDLFESFRKLSKISFFFTVKVQIS